MFKNSQGFDCYNRCVWTMQFIYSNASCAFDLTSFPVLGFNMKATFEINKSLPRQLDVLECGYSEISPFLMRISLAIRHISQGLQKKVMRASLHIVPCGQEKKKKTTNNHETGTLMSEEMCCKSD